MNTPVEIANNYIDIGKGKVQIKVSKVFVLAIFAGIFIAIGGAAATAAAVGVTPGSIGKLLGACIFPGGLTMVLLAGGELFTGNCLLVIPLLEKEITILQLLKNWIIVYIGNFIGGLMVAAICVYGHQFSLFQNQMAVSALRIAAEKSTITFGDALLKGTACNFLVCIAVWVSFAAKNVTGKIMALFFPILIFVLCGFEHCVANMYYIPAGLMAKTNEVYGALAVESGISLEAITWSNIFLNNLLPVTLGNIIGGSLLVGCGYWYIYIYGKRK